MNELRFKVRLDFKDCTFSMLYLKAQHSRQYIGLLCEDRVCLFIYHILNLYIDVKNIQQRVKCNSFNIIHGPKAILLFKKSHHFWKLGHSVPCIRNTDWWLHTFYILIIEFLRNFSYYHKSTSWLSGLLVNVLILFLKKRKRENPSPCLHFCFLGGKGSLRCRGSECNYTLDRIVTGKQGQQ